MRRLVILILVLAPWFWPRVERLPRPLRRRLSRRRSPSGEHADPGGRHWRGAAGCGSGPGGRDIVSAGSSTVYPLSERMAERFADEGYTGIITIDSIGTGGGSSAFARRVRPTLPTPAGGSRTRRRPTARRSGGSRSSSASDRRTGGGGEQGEYLPDQRHDRGAGQDLCGRQVVKREPQLAGGADPALHPGTDSGTFDFSWRRYSTRTRRRC